MKIEAKNIKTMRDHEGGTAYDANIYVDGKKVGFIIEDGWGGGLQVAIPDDVQKKMIAHIKSLPVVGDKRWHGDLEIYLEDLVNLVLSSRELKRKLKKPFAYEKGSKDGVFTEWKCKWGEPRGNKPWEFVLSNIKTANPGMVFLNEMAFDHALKIYCPSHSNATLDDVPPLRKGN